MGDITVIYDGQCHLCRNSISWISKKLAINVVDFHNAELARYGLSREKCAREVFVVTDTNRYSGAQAAAFLLKARGNKVLAALITISGPVGRAVYRWVAANRNSLPVKILSRLLKS